MLSWISSSLFGTKTTSEQTLEKSSDTLVETKNGTETKPSIGKISPFHPMHLLHAEMVMRPEPAYRAYRDATDEDAGVHYESFSIERRLPVRKVPNNPKPLTRICKNDLFNGYSMMLYIHNHTNTTSGQVTFSETDDSITHTCINYIENPTDGDEIGESTTYSDNYGVISKTKYHYWQKRAIDVSYYKFVTSELFW